MKVKYKTKKEYDGYTYFQYENDELSVVYYPPQIMRASWGFYAPPEKTVIYGKKEKKGFTDECDMREQFDDVIPLGFTACKEKIKEMYNREL